MPARVSRYFLIAAAVNVGVSAELIPSWISPIVRPADDTSRSSAWRRRR
jgi:hypothetical protein